MRGESVVANRSQHEVPCCQAAMEAIEPRLLLSALSYSPTSQQVSANFGGDPTVAVTVPFTQQVTAPEKLGGGPKAPTAPAFTADLHVSSYKGDGTDHPDIPAAWFSTDPGQLVWQTAGGGARTWTVSISVPPAETQATPGIYTRDGVYDALVQAKPDEKVADLGLGLGGGTIVTLTVQGSTITITTDVPETTTLSISPAGAVYNGQTYSLSNITATHTPADAEGSVSYAFYADADGTMPIAVPVHAGTYYVRGSFTSDDATKWTDAESDVESVTISKADATIVVDGYTGTYDGKAHGAAGTATGVKGETLTGLDLGETFTHVPGGTAHWSFTDVTGDYNNASGTADIRISKADATVKVSDYTGVYDGKAHGAAGTATGVKGETLAGLDLGETFTHVPGGTAHWNFTDVTGDYNNASGTADIQISRADTVLTLDATKTAITDSSIRFTASLYCPTTTVNEGTIAFLAVLNSSGVQVAAQTVDVASGSGVADFDLPAGTYTVTATFAQTQDFNASSDSGTLTVSYTDGAVAGFAGGGLGYWSGKNGLKIVTTGDLAALNSLYLADATGKDMALTAANLSSYLLNATATNMSYMLAAQMVAAKLDALHTTGLGDRLVDATSLLKYSQFAGSGVLGNGFISVNNLIAAANTALVADHNAVAGDANRAYQETLKNVLEKVANDGSVFLTAINMTWTD